MAMSISNLLSNSVSPPINRKFSHEEEQKISSSSSSSSSPANPQPMVLESLPIVNHDALALSSLTSPSINIEIFVGVIEDAIEEQAAIMQKPVSEMTFDDLVQIGEQLSLTEELIDLVRPFTRSNLLEKIHSYLQSNRTVNPSHKMIKAVFKQLYFCSLLNSELNNVLPVLEEKIEEMILDISQESINNLLNTSNLLLQVSSPDYENQVCMNHTLQRLTRIRNYDWYLEPKQREAISLMTVEDEVIDQPQYPKCKARFRTLCSRLEAIKINKTINCPVLLAQLHAKNLAWRSVARQSTVQNEQLFTKEKAFENKHLTSFWIAGANILKNALKNELKDKTFKNNSQDPLIKSTLQAMKDHRMGTNIQDLLMNIRKNTFDPESSFCNSVWTHFLSEPEWEGFEIPSLVTFLLKNCLPQDLQALTDMLNGIDQESKEIGKEIPLTGDQWNSLNQQKADAIMKVCNGLFRRPLTYSSLKNWCKARKI